MDPNYVHKPVVPDDHIYAHLLNAPHPYPPPLATLEGERKLKEAMQAVVLTPFQQEFIQSQSRFNPGINMTRCPVPGCDLVFTRAGNGAFHMDSHTKEEVAALKQEDKDHLSEVLMGLGGHFPAKPRGKKTRNK